MPKAKDERLPPLQQKGQEVRWAQETCAALVSELMAAPQLPSLATMRPGSKLPSLEATEDSDGRAWSEHSLGATAMESELQMIAAKREKLGDTLSTQEVLAQQVNSDLGGPVTEVQAAPVLAVRTKVRRVRDLMRGRHRSEVNYDRALPHLGGPTELKLRRDRAVAARKAADRVEAGRLRGLRAKSRGGG